MTLSKAAAWLPLSAEERHANTIMQARCLAGLPGYSLRDKSTRQAFVVDTRADDRTM